MSCFASRGNSIGKKLIRLNWEKAVYQPLFMLANTLTVKIGSSFVLTAAVITLNNNVRIFWYL